MSKRELRWLLRCKLKQFGCKFLFKEKKTKAGGGETKETFFGGTEKPAQWHVFGDAVVTPGTMFPNHHLLPIRYLFLISTPKVKQITFHPSHCLIKRKYMQAFLYLWIQTWKYNPEQTWVLGKEALLHRTVAVSKFINPWNKPIKAIDSPGKGFTRKEIYSCHSHTLSHSSTVYLVFFLKNIYASVA